MSIISDKLPLLRVQSADHVLVIHGGAGTMSREGSTPEQRAAYKAALSEALQAGNEVLKRGGEALDAVVAAVSVMEDNPLFNAGKGAVFNKAGKNELEASLMLTKPPMSHPGIPSTRRGLALTLLTRAKNPSEFVRALYLSPSEAPHTLLSGATAESIGQALGQTLVDPSYFFTKRRWEEHRRGLGLGDDLDVEGGIVDPMDDMPTGTVGAVALDERGCIAVLTSTGGRTNKTVGRIGDTPLMGCGFWAEEWKPSKGIRQLWDKVTRRRIATAVGISGTGDGDYFIRQATAVTIANRVRFKKEPLQKATKHAVDSLLADGGLGGVIALDNRGRVSMSLNCAGMYRGVIRVDGVARTAIFSDEELS